MSDHVRRDRDGHAGVAGAAIEGHGGLRLGHRAVRSVILETARLRNRASTPMASASSTSLGMASPGCRFSSEK